MEKVFHLYPVDTEALSDMATHEYAGFKRPAQYLHTENYCFIGLDMTYRILYWQETNFEICSIANHSGNGLPGIKFFT